MLTKAKWWKRKERGTEWVQEERAFVTSDRGGRRRER